MADPFAVEVAVRRFTAWRSALALLGLGAAACMVAWALSRSSWPPGLQIGLGCFGSALVGVVIATLWRPRAGVLSRVGGAWSFDPDPRSADASAPSGAVPVQIEVALDLGSFVLLRWLAEPGPGASLRWLPVERRGLEDRWEALRCALYSPLPSAAADASSTTLGLSR